MRGKVEGLRDLGRRGGARRLGSQDLVERRTACEDSVAATPRRPDCSARKNRVSQAQTRAHINPHSVAATPRILHCRGRKTRARHAQNRPRPAPKSVAATPSILDCRTPKSFASDSEKRARFWSRKTSSVSGRAWRAHNTFPVENMMGARVAPIAQYY